MTTSISSQAVWKKTEGRKKKRNKKGGQTDKLRYRAYIHSSVIIKAKVRGRKILWTRTLLYLENKSEKSTQKLSGFWIKKQPWNKSSWHTDGHTGELTGGRTFVIIE